MSVNGFAQSLDIGARLTMRMIERLLDVIDRGIWHPTAFQDLEPFLRGFLLNSLLNQVIKLFPMLYSVTVGDKARVRLPFGEP